MNASEFKTKTNDTSLATLVINGLFSPVAIGFNALIAFLILRQPSLRNPSNLMIVGLASVDFATGLLLQPVFVIKELFYLNSGFKKVRVLDKVLLSSMIMCSGSAFAIIAGVSLEMALALHFHLRYHSIITTSRAVIFLCLTWLVCAIIVVIDRLLPEEQIFNYPAIVVIPILIAITIISHIKIFRIVRRHRRQISNQTVSVDNGGSQSTRVNTCKSRIARLDTNSSRNTQVDTDDSKVRRMDTDDLRDTPINDDGSGTARMNIDRSQTTRINIDGSQTTRMNIDRPRTTRMSIDGSRTTQISIDGSRTTRMNNDGSRTTRTNNVDLRSTRRHINWSQVTRIARETKRAINLAIIIGLYACFYSPHFVFQLYTISGYNTLQRFETGDCYRWTETVMFLRASVNPLVWFSKKSELRNALRNFWNTFRNH